MKWYYYRDIITNKLRRTRGIFAGWIVDGLDIRRAVFVLKRGEWLIPDYCLTPETRKELEGRS